ncbi:MAG: hypothetical protein HQL05_06330 [Nitrospirae bacterium]|uniref:NEPxGxxU motif selenoprotein TsoC n=1 Tax=Candidatus Magnetobacterium casense TaxID=1455061 RepID=UPI00058F46FA|nr:hypothetical protein [Candidatus Magnetobacterium casensis]MBF0337433.1 hypothetical protein [Nitrospirota bacterium]
MNIKLYLNAPPGGKCSNIIALVSEMKGRYGFSVETISNADLNKGGCSECSDASLKLPAVSINDDIVFQGRDITADELEKEILKRLQTL